MRYFLTGAVLLTAASVIRAHAPRGSDDPRGADSPVNVGYVLAALTPEKALPLSGKRAIFLIEIIDRRPDRFGPRGTSPYPWCRCDDSAVSYVELDQGVHASTVMTVEATLNVLHYPGNGGFPDRYYFVLSNPTKRW